MDPETIQAEIDSEATNPPEPQAGSNTPSGDSGQVEAEAPAGEFAGLSRTQLKRNMRAIDDAIDHYATGEWSASRFKVFLRSVGLKEQTIDELLHDCAA